MKTICRLSGILLFVAGALVVPASSVSAQTIGPKIGVIDVNRVVAESALGKEVFARLKKLQEAKIEEAKKREKELKDLEQKVSDQKFTLAEDKLAALQKDYQQKAIDFKRFQDDAERELREAEQRELRELEKKIMPVVSTIGREENFALLFNKFQSGLVYADDAVDVTEVVIKRFNAATAGAADAKAAEKPAEAKPADKPADKKPADGAKKK